MSGSTTSTWPGLARAMALLIESGVWSDMTPTEKAIWPVLAKWVPQDGGTFYRGGADIARDAGVSTTRVWPAIDRLESRGLLLRVQRGRSDKGGRRSATIYRMLTPVAKCDRSHNATSRIMRLEPVAQCDQNRSHNATPYTKEDPKKTQRARSADSELPEVLDNSTFRQAWADWQTHRRQMKKPLTKIAASRALAKLARMGSTRAIAAIEHSIANNWRGIYEPNPGEADHTPAVRDEHGRTEHELDPAMLAD